MHAVEDGDASVDVVVELDVTSKAEPACVPAMSGSHRQWPVRAGDAPGDVGRLERCLQLFVPDQYIEVSGLPDGYYLLDTLADADGLVLEANEHNNEAAALVRICGDAAEVVGEEPACA